MSEASTQDGNDIQVIAKEYDELIKKGIEACKNFDLSRKEIEKLKPEITEDPLLNWHLESEAIYKLNICSSLASPKQNIDIPMIRNSVEFIKDVSTRVIFIMDNLEYESTSKKLPPNQNFLKIKNLFIETKKMQKKYNIKF